MDEDSVAEAGSGRDQICAAGAERRRDVIRNCIAKRGLAPELLRPAMRRYSAAGYCNQEQSTAAARHRGAWISIAAAWGSSAKAQP